MKKLAKNLRHPRQEHERRKAERQARQQGEQQQGESSSQPPPGLASSSEQATTPAPPPLQSSPVSSLTPSRFSREFTAQNQGRDSVDSNRSSVPRYMLHGTSASNAPNILETGLQTSYGGQEGGASKKRDDPKYIESSQGVVHGTPSRRVAGAYAEYHNKLSAEGEIEENSAFIGFRNVHPESTEKDPHSRGSYKISQSIPSNQVVPVRPEKVAEGEDKTGLFIP
ncbi:MAG: hypothetical protein V7K18_07250 [Nostoc sp.]|uniref:hypothetical protein n=1 Tax=Nostoc sp. TaxID=1180 RepID=UPI002FF7CCAD